MSDSVYYILGAIIMVIAVVAIVAGVKSVVAEGKKVWSMLRELFGVANGDVAALTAQDSAPGKLVLLNQEFVGAASVVEQGIIFRRDFMSGHELVLFPWNKIQEFKTHKADRFTATFSFENADGSLLAVNLPWSDGLDERAAAAGRERI